MTDSIRPPASFLAPEIISNILGFVYTEHKESWKPNPVHRELAPFTTISSDWTDEAQRRLFEGVTIEKSITLLKLVLALESTPRLGHFVLSLYIRLESTDPVTDANLVFRLLSSVPNLTSFTFIDPPFDSFSQENSTAMQLAPILLPKVTTLHLEAGRDESWKKEVFDFIVGAAAANLLELGIKSNRRYVGPMWKSVPVKLRKLSTGHPFPIAQLKGLESLDIGYIEEVENNQDSFLPFFEAVGPTLVEISCRNLPAEVYPFLTVLKRLRIAILPFDNSTPPKLLLPSTLICLKISDWGRFSPTTLPITTWSHLTLLEELDIYYLYRSFDLNQLPPLKRIIIHTCQEEVLLESMENLSVGQFVIGELELLEIYDVAEEGGFLEDFDGEEIRKRCEELGIKYTLAIRNY